MGAVRKAATRFARVPWQASNGRKTNPRSSSSNAKSWANRRSSLRIIDPVENHADPACQSEPDVTICTAAVASMAMNRSRIQSSMPMIAKEKNDRENQYRNKQAQIIY